MPNFCAKRRIAMTWIAALAFCGFPHLVSAQNLATESQQETKPNNQANPELQASPEIELGDGGNSLGEIIRGGDMNAEALDKGLGKWLEQGIKSGSSGAEASRDRLTTEHVMELRKPMRDIRVEATEDFTKVPANRAGKYMVKEPVLEITSSGILPPLPDRYTLCLTHRPLYYEQPLLERCGRGFCYAQNSISAAQFCVNTLFLPYHMGKQRPDCPVPAGGDCLSCQPYPLDCSPFPLDVCGITAEAAAFAGFTFLLL